MPFFNMRKIYLGRASCAGYEKAMWYSTEPREPVVPTKNPHSNHAFPSYLLQTTASPMLLMYEGSI